MAISRKWKKLIQCVFVLFCLGVLCCLCYGIMGSEVGENQAERVLSKLLKERGTPGKPRTVRAHVDKSPGTPVRKRKKVQRRKDYQGRSCNQRLLLNTFRYRRVREAARRGGCRIRKPVVVQQGPSSWWLPQALPCSPPWGCPGTLRPPAEDAPEVWPFPMPITNESSVFPYLLQVLPRDDPELQFSIMVMAFTFRCFGILQLSPQLHQLPVIIVKVSDPVIAWSRGFVCVFPQEEQQPIWVPERLTKMISTNQKGDDLAQIHNSWYPELQFGYPYIFHNGSPTTGG